MNSKGGGGKPSFASNVGSGNRGPNGGSSGPNIQQLSCGMAHTNINSKNKTATSSSSSASAPNAWGPPEGYPRQVRGPNGGAGRATGNNWNQVGNGGAGSSYGNNWNQAGNGGATRPPGSSSVNATNQGGAWRTPVNWANDSTGSVGRGSNRSQPAPRTWESAYMAPPPPAAHLSPPLEHGWQWGARSGAFNSQATYDGNFSNVPHDGSVTGYDPNRQDNVSVAAAADEILDDSDDDSSDGFDSDASQKSHESRKNHKWLKVFFEALDKLTVEELNDSSRQWHCAACQKGPGAIDWYTGLQQLITHAKTKGTQRARLHRELAKLLEEELRRRGTSVIPAGEVFGKWKGLRETMTDHEIVWPPMVVVMNTLLDKDENEKWTGMGNQELLEYFSTYHAVKARHSYGPHGHRGMSLLIFEPTALGYLEAERLHKHFAEQGTDKDAWLCRPVLFYPGGKRQLYGYLASKEDMDVFNQHCQEPIKSNGKSCLKFEIKSYQEAVVIPMKQMSEDNQQLVWLKNKVVKQERRTKALEETFDVVSKKLRETMEENRIVRLRTKKQFEENKEEMDYQESFFKEQMDKVHKDIEEKERKYEILLQEERAKAKQSQVQVNSASNEVQSRRKQEIERFIDSQAKGVEEFVAERDNLVSEHEDRKLELKRKYLEEEVELEKAFDLALTKLMEKFSPSAFETSSSSS